MVSLHETTAALPVRYFENGMSTENHQSSRPSLRYSSGKNGPDRFSMMGFSHTHDVAPQPFKRFYIMGKIINESKYSTVSYCQDLTTKQAFVVKTLDRRNKHNRDKVEQELKVMRLPEARSIVRG